MAIARHGIRACDEGLFKYPLAINEGHTEEIESPEVIHNMKMVERLNDLLAGSSILETDCQDLHLLGTLCQNALTSGKIVGDRHRPEFFQLFIPLTERGILFKASKSSFIIDFY